MFIVGQGLYMLALGVPTGLHQACIFWTDSFPISSSVIPVLLVEILQGDLSKNASDLMHLLN